MCACGLVCVCVFVCNRWRHCLTPRAEILHSTFYRKVNPENQYPGGLAALKWDCRFPTAQTVSGTTGLGLVSFGLTFNQHALIQHLKDHLLLFDLEVSLEKKLKVVSHCGLLVFFFFS